MLGLSRLQHASGASGCRIAFRLTLPALVNEAIMMLKSSSLISVVGVIELTRMAQDLAARTYRPLELYAAAGLIYLCHQHRAWRCSGGWLERAADAGGGRELRSRAHRRLPARRSCAASA